MAGVGVILVQWYLLWRRELSILFVVWKTGTAALCPQLSQWIAQQPICCSGEWETVKSSMLRNHFWTGREVCNTSEMSSLSGARCLAFSRTEIVCSDSFLDTPLCLMARNRLWGFFIEDYLKPTIRKEQFWTLHSKFKISPRKRFWFFYRLLFWVLFRSWSSLWQEICFLFDCIQEHWSFGERFFRLFVSEKRTLNKCLSWNRSPSWHTKSVYPKIMVVCFWANCFTSHQFIIEWS